MVDETSEIRASEGGAAAQLAALLRGAPVVVEALRAARDADAPDWLICAGAILSARFYERRVADKGWRERWPRMRYLPPGAPC